VSSIRIGSRGSTLALAQARWVQKQIENGRPDLTVELVIIKTSGDRLVDAPLRAIGGKGLFTKEIEDALLRREIDIAVHSMKDLPTELPAGLTIAAVPEREDARDVLVSCRGNSLKELPAGTRIGTGSLRREAQLLAYRRDLFVVPIRGNVDTRLKKLDKGEVDALVLAAAGLKRISQGDRIGEFIPAEICVSAVAQGALALEARADSLMGETLSFLHDIKADAEVSAERAFLRRLGGGCQVPVGARATVEGNRLDILGIVAEPDGSALCRGEKSGSPAAAAALGQELAEQLLREGADKMLRNVNPHSNQYGEAQ
jgi:hydroxymethylbilane synthase